MREGRAQWDRFFLSEAQSIPGPIAEPIRIYVDAQGRTVRVFAEGVSGGPKVREGALTRLREEELAQRRSRYVPRYELARGSDPALTMGEDDDGELAPLRVRELDLERDLRYGNGPYHEDT